jgi:hypothetical protein
MRYLMLACALLCVVAWARPTATALRVPDGTIAVDGSAADWDRIASIIRGTVTSGAEALWLPAEAELGVWTGADDSSFTVAIVHDAAYLYLFAQVHDQALCNYATADDPFTGDDFEVFISAGPDDVRFEKKTADFRQLVFLPGRVNPAFPKTLIWQEKENPGVQAASRITLRGYVIEVRIPKALFPNWKAHPNLASIGFDCQINDADAPGIDCHHPSVKGARQLLSLGRHFQSPMDMGLLTLETTPMKLLPYRKGPVPMPTKQLIAALKKLKSDDHGSLPEHAVSRLDEKDAAQIAEAALQNDNPAARRAGALMLALRPELQAPVERLQFLCQPAFTPVQARNEWLPLEHPDIYAYYIRAVGERSAFLPSKKSSAIGNLDPSPLLRIGDLPVLFVNTHDAPLRLTYLYCLGGNGDKAATPVLLPLLKDKGLRTRQQAAMALALLKDPAALPALREMEKSDPDPYGKKQATLAIAAIEAKK